jgi:hypothetical protein
MQRTIDLTDPNWNNAVRRYGNAPDTDDIGDGDRELPTIGSAEANQHIQGAVQDFVLRELYGSQSLDVMIRHEMEDSRTGLPVVLNMQRVHGGAELFDTPPPAGSAALPPALPQGFPSNQPLQAINPEPPLIDYQTTQRTQKTAVSPMSSNLNQLFSELGLEFLASPQTPPNIAVKICFSGPIRFTIPVLCHKLVVTDQMVVLISDKRQREGMEMDFGIENPEIQTELLLPDQQRISVITMAPKALSFDIGVLRCFLFFRSDEPEPQPITQLTTQPAAAPQNAGELSERLSERLDAQGH